MQDLILVLASVMAMSVGFLAPFIMTLAYVWVDIFTPQLVSDGILGGLPVALVFGSLAIITYVVKDRRDPPKFNAVMALQIGIAIWITLTTTWAVNPDAAYTHWNTTIKVVLFAIFLPFAIRTRVHIEAFALVFLFSIIAHLMPWGVKTFLTGGGYGLSLGLLRSNTAYLAESSTVSTVGVMIAPLILALRKHSILLPRTRLRSVGAITFIALGLVASIGTFARTGLVAIAVAGAAMWLRAKNKLFFSIVALLMVGLMLSVTSDKWTSRIETTADYQSESSAATRLAVWKWTLGFVQSHPFGGGFSAYIGARIELPGQDGAEPSVQYSRAYHNMYFSTLGDHGYPGLAMYVGMLACTLLAFRRARRLTLKLEDHVWCADLAQAGQTALLTMMAGGMFVEIDWTAIIWYLIALAVCLHQYALRVTAKTVNLAGVAPVPAASVLDPFDVRGPMRGGRMPAGVRTSQAALLRRTSL